MIRRGLSVNIIASTIGITLIGFGLLIYMFIAQQERSLLREVERASKLMSQPIMHAVQEDMMAGRADMARYLIDGMKGLHGVKRLQIIRDNGIEEAFRDFKGLRKVEDVYGRLEPDWTKAHEDIENNVAEGVYTPEFKEAFDLFHEGKLERISYLEKAGDERLFTYLVPIVAKEGCKRCHADEGRIRGVLMISASLEDMYATMADRRMQWGLYGLFITICMVALLTFFIRRITRPLHEVAEAAGQIAQGNYSVNLPIKTGDEIGLLSESFNCMAREIKARTAFLEKSEASLANAQRIAKLGNWDWDIVNNTLYWSDEIYRIFGLGKSEFGATYEAFLNSVHPDDRELVKRSVDEALSENKPYAIDHRIVLPDGTERIVHEHAEVTFNEAGEPIRMVGTVQDVTDRKEAEAELTKLSAAIDKSINLVFITTINGNIEYVNSTFEKVTGWAKEEAIGRNPRILASGETTKAEYQVLWEAILAGKTWRGEFKNRTKDGEFFWASGIITPIKNERGEITQFLAVQEDVTEKKKAEERSEYLANNDALTGLLNRKRFIELLNDWLNAYSNENGVLFVIGMDDFRLINDSYGHGVGDSLLQRVARLMQNDLIEMNLSHVEDPGKALLGRMGGDEFAIFIPGFEIDKGFEACERLREGIEGLNFSELDLNVTASIGIVFYPGHGRTVNELFTKVDAALSSAKQAGRNRCHLHTPEDNVLENINLRLAERMLITKGLNGDHFIPWFQPILSLKDGRISHYEALARLRDEDGKILPPSAFIDAAERYGLIGAIDRKIIEKTMRVQVEMARQNNLINFGMNLSGASLGDESILLFLQSKIWEIGADPSSLIFEITETAAVRDLDKAIQFINTLKSMGCRFSLDDFGVGFTSFIYLKEMQVDYIKIDGAFIKKLAESRNDQLFVKAIVDVAKGMGIKTVAEFVENEETLRFLKEYGVDYAQGYFIGKPGPDLLPD